MIVNSLLLTVHLNIVMIVLIHLITVPVSTYINNNKYQHYFLRNGMPFPESKLPDFNNKKDMEVSLNTSKEYNKNDVAQVPEKFRQDNVVNGNGASNLQNGLLQYAANEISKGKGEFLYILGIFKKKQS